MASRLTTLIVVSIVAATFIAGIITRAQRDDTGPIDLIVLNGKVYGGRGTRTAEAVAVRGNTIVSVGSNREIKRLRRPQTTVIDAHGGSVLPGFNDPHVDLVAGGLELLQADLSGATADDLDDRLLAHATTRTGDDWILGRGLSADVLDPGRTPRAQLDAIVPDRPVLVAAADGQTAWANSPALKLAGITRRTRAPKRGVIGRSADGEPSGLVKDAAVGLIRAAVPEPDHLERLDALRLAVGEAHRLGITSVQNASDDAETLDLLDGLRVKGELRLRTYHAVRAGSDATDAELETLEATRREHEDDPLLKAGSVELDAGDFRTLGRLTQVVTLFDKRGWQVWILAGSEEAAGMALDALEAASRANPAPARGGRHRVEYAGALDPETLQRAARLGVITTPGSSWPAAPLDPRLRLRDAASAEAHESSTPVETAIDAYTSGAAFASFDEQRKGRLARGMLADIVILSGDIFGTPVERLLDVTVETTIFDGEVVYSRAESE